MTVTTLSGFQSPMSCMYETTRVPGRSSRHSFGRTRRLISGHRKRATTVAPAISVSKRSSVRKVTLSATPAFRALATLSAMRSGSMSTHTPRAAP